MVEDVAVEHPGGVGVGVGVQSTHIDEQNWLPLPSEIEASDRSIDALHPLDNPSQKRTDPRSTSGEVWRVDRSIR